jgi:hypothetical protein
MGIAGMSGSACGRIVGIYGQGMFFNFIALHVMQMAIMKIVNMSLVDNALVAAICAMGVGRMIMVAVSHDKAPKS